MTLIVLKSSLFGESCNLSGTGIAQLLQKPTAWKRRAWLMDNDDNDGNDNDNDDGDDNYAQILVSQCLYCVCLITKVVILYKRGFFCK